jgi:hypothetical protein
MKMNNVNKQNCFKKLNKLDSSSTLFVLQFSTEFEPSLNQKKKKKKIGPGTFCYYLPIIILYTQVQDFHSARKFICLLTVFRIESNEIYTNIIG